MLKNELKAALAILGTVFVPVVAQADQAMSSNQGQQPGYTPGEAIKAGQLPGGYSQSATYLVDNAWDVFLTADWIYWDWAQDGSMGGGFSGLSGSSLDFELHPNKIYPGYTSGFQVGLGFNMHGMDDWNFYGEYTWYQNSGNQTSSGSLSVIDPLVSTDFDLSRHISLKYSNADFLLARPFYFGKKLTANFYTGLKALWITRKGDTSGSGSANVLGLATTTIDSLTTSSKVSSWGLGPKFGFDTNWLLGYGFKILSSISASVLYTRYTSSSDMAVEGTGDLLDTTFSVDANVGVSDSNYGILRAITESALGLGWGTAFCDDQYHIDFGITYDFNVYWNYVTRRHNPGNLYLHGLNIQARFDF